MDKKMKDEKILLIEFIEYLRNCGEDIFYAFDDTESVVELFLDKRKIKTKIN